MDVTFRLTLSKIPGPSVKYKDTDCCVAVGPEVDDAEVPFEHAKNTTDVAIARTDKLQTKYLLFILNNLE